MRYYKREISQKILNILEKGKSVLLLGPRQTGKTTFIRQELKPDLEFNFAKPSIRRKFEDNPERFEAQLYEEIKKFNKIPVIFVDEVQKVPAIMDVLQVFIDDQKSKFIISGSSAKKLKHGANINLLPGRVILFHMHPLSISEINLDKINIKDLLLYGALPEILQEEDLSLKEQLLNSYVNIYLEEEVRNEALVRNVGTFSNFLQIAAGESGKQVNLSKISQDIGVAVTTINSYYQVLEDCLITHRIEPISNSTSKRKLIKSPRFLFFDLGVRRISSGEGTKLPDRLLGELFEQFIGLQLKTLLDLNYPNARLRYWKDVTGPEVDYVIEIDKKFIPLEIKWSDNVTSKAAKHLYKFLDEYKDCEQAFIICRADKKYNIDKEKNITVLPWQDLREVLN